MAADRHIISKDVNSDRWIVSNKHGVIASSKRPTVLITRHPEADIDDLSAVQAHIAGEVLAGVIKETKKS